MHSVVVSDQVFGRLVVNLSDETNLDIVLDRIYFCIVEARELIELIARSLWVHPYRLFLKLFFAINFPWAFPFPLFFFRVNYCMILGFDAPFSSCLTLIG
jgi:hypothetical protein